MGAGMDEVQENYGAVYRVIKEANLTGTISPEDLVETVGGDAATALPSGRRVL